MLHCFILLFILELICISFFKLNIVYVFVDDHELSKRKLDKSPWFGTNLLFGKKIYVFLSFLP